MSLSEEIVRLDELRTRGVLTDDEFAQAKARALAGEPPGSALALQSVSALRRSRLDRMVAGVCGGLAQITGLASWAWRVLFVAFMLFGGAGLLIYALLWVFVPEE